MFDAVRFRLGSIPFVASVALAGSANVYAQEQSASSDATHSLTSAGTERAYVLHVPAGYSGDAIPLVLNFHPSRSTPEDQIATSGFNAIADREGFAVAYPAGVFATTALEQTWNANVEEGVDDVQFARDVIDDVGGKLSIDRDRIYVTGFSGGARMSSRLACALADILAAAAPVAGLQYPDDCVPVRPVSIVAFHGKADRNNPYEVTADPQPHWRMGVETAAEKWRSALRCGEGAMDGGFTDQPGLVLRVYPPCSEATALQLYISETDEHVWPEGASERIWTFFEAHPR